MQVFRKKYFIHPEIQRPLLIVFITSFVLLILIQIIAFYASIAWLGSMTELNMSLIVDFQLLEVWKKMLLFIFFVSSAVNLSLAIFMTVFISNRFAGPIYRLEKELDLYISGEKKQFNVSFRKTDYLHPLAEKINQALNNQNNL